MTIASEENLNDDAHVVAATSVPERTTKSSTLDISSANDQKRDDTTTTTSTSSPTSARLRKCLSADDLLALPSAKLSVSKTNQNSDDAGSVYSAASDWMIASFFPASSQADVNHPDLAETDDSSVGSSSSSATGGYFDQSDFIPSNWENASDYIPPIGLAMVAGGIACFHPLVFVAGLLTAVGTLTAAGATYDFCSTTSTFCYGAPTTTIEDGGAAGEVGGTDQKQLTDSRTAKDVNVAEGRVLGGTLSQLTSASSTQGGGVGPSNSSQAGISGTQRRAHGLSGTGPNNLATMGTDEALQWVQTYYPALPNMTLEKVAFHGLNALEFFDVFFADEAPFGFETFHKLRRDKEVQYGLWEELGVVQTPCLVSNAPAIPQGGPNAGLTQRVLDYQAKTNSFLGPAFAKTIKTQRALKASKRLLVLESKITLQDIPFANRFYIVERWVVTAETHPESADDASSSMSPRGVGGTRHHKGKSGAKMPSCAYLTVTFEVVFTQSCPFEATVMKESAKTIAEICTQWNKMAQEGLKRTEETRRLRLEQQEKEADTIAAASSDVQSSSTDVVSSTSTGQSVGTSTRAEAADEADESIEIESMGRRRSWVAGDAFPKGLDENAPALRPPRSSSRKGKRKTPHTSRSLSRSFSNLIGRSRQRSSTS